MKTLYSASKTIGLVAGFMAGSLAIITLRRGGGLANGLQRSACLACKSCMSQRNYAIQSLSAPNAAPSAAPNAASNTAPSAAPNTALNDAPNIAADLPSNTTRDNCADNQRFVFTRPSSNYEDIRDGSLHAIDVSNAFRTLIDFEFRRIRLTGLESEIGHYLLQSKTYKTIGSDISLGESTVKHHAGNIYKKAQCNNREEFATDIMNRVLASPYSWRSRRDLEHDMERMLQL